MTKEQYIQKMEKHSKTFLKVWDEIVKDTNSFIEDNPKENNYYYVRGSKVETLIESLSLSGAWIHDRLNGKIGIVSDKKYRGSLTKKIRKALGFTY